MRRAAAASGICGVTVTTCRVMIWPTWYACQVEADFAHAEGRGGGRQSGLQVPVAEDPYQDAALHHQEVMDPVLPHQALGGVETVLGSDTQHGLCHPLTDAHTPPHYV